MAIEKGLHSELKLTKLDFTIKLEAVAEFQLDLCLSPRSES